MFISIFTITIAIDMFMNIDIANAIHIFTENTFAAWCMIIQHIYIYIYREREREAYIHTYMLS